MSGSRIFIGNLSTDVKEKHLIDKFSPYGSVTGLEIKSKLDIDGNPTIRFAYLNLAADLAKIEECVNELNGRELRRSVLKVEVARESFLQKLKWEREQNSEVKPKKQQDFQSNNYENASYNFRTSNTDESFRSERKPPETFPSKDISQYNYNYNEPDISNKNEENYSHENNFPKYERRSEAIGHSPFYGGNAPLTTFKRFDPTAPENQEKRVKKVKKKMKNTDQTSKKYVQVSTDLCFNEGSAATFSLLDKFSENNESKELLLDTFEKEIDTPMLEKKTYTPVYSRKKSRNFFIAPDDPSLKEGVEWITRPLTEEKRAEFESIRLNLVDLYKLRNSRANRQFNSHRVFIKVKGHPKYQGIGRTWSKNKKTL